MGQIFSTCQLVVLTFAVAERKFFFFFFFFLNRSRGESFYVVKLNLVSFFFCFFFLPKAEFFPRTMKISQKVSKTGDIARNV